MTIDIDRVISKGKNEQNNPELLSVIYSLGRDVQNETEYAYSLEKLTELYDEAGEKGKAHVVQAMSMLAVLYGKLERSIAEPFITQCWVNSSDDNKLMIQETDEDINNAFGWELTLK